STSSVSAYGFIWYHRLFLPYYLPLDENHPTLAQDAYGLSKMAGEEIAHGYHRRCGLRVCSIRPPWVIHPDRYGSDVRPRLEGPQDWASVLFTYVDVRDLASPTAWRSKHRLTSCRTRFSTSPRMMPWR
ncbi:MAG: SDR family oxidoreductase, partial [Chloroflexota bacterium]|nr:SDR family oxidoreductase [Chloroflexota bacterium]